MNLPRPTAEIAPGFVLGVADQAYEHLRAGQPVHLNCPFPEPLYARSPTFDAASLIAALGAWPEDETPWNDWRNPVQVDASQPDWEDFCACRGLVVAGRIDDGDDALAVASLAERLGWPLLTDVQSQLRGLPGSLPYPTLALRSPAVRGAIEGAQVVLQFGGRLVDKTLLALLRRDTLGDHWLIDPSAKRLLPDHRRHRRIVSTARRFVQAHPAATHRPWLTDSCRRDEHVREAGECWSELGVCSTVWQSALGTLLVGNSLPIRIVDRVAGPRDELGVALFANRGASGIDGLVATAVGLGRIRGGPTTVLIGDISTLHDLNSLALLRAHSAPFVIVVVNNDGGSIFRMLPVPEVNGLREAFYVAPHGLNFQGAAQMFGFDYRTPEDLQEFRRCYQSALGGGTTLIEVTFPSGQGVDALRALDQAVSGPQ
jgi:2-succinyl-5-enolpyruvyl-6-hydroxy-3-cyclohexene-1-carboxylate synthase